jgi:hypothetical protein
VDDGLKFGFSDEMFCSWRVPCSVGAMIGIDCRNYEQPSLFEDPISTSFNVKVCVRCCGTCIISHIHLYLQLYHQQASLFDRGYSQKYRRAIANALSLPNWGDLTIIVKEHDTNTRETAVMANVAFLSEDERAASGSVTKVCQNTVLFLSCVFVITPIIDQHGQLFY